MWSTLPRARETVVQDAPSGRQPLEQPADVLLAARSPIVPVHERQDVFVYQQDREQESDL